LRKKMACAEAALLRQYSVKSLLAGLLFSGKTVSLGEVYVPAVSLSARCGRDPRLLMIPSPEEILC
jgi:hypothetical protein